MGSLKGIDIFLFKAYMEGTFWADTGAAVLITDLLVNFLFAILNTIVLFFKTVLASIEKFSVYDTYKVAVYDVSKVIWNRLVSGNGSSSRVVLGSVIMTLITVTVFYLFVQWAFSRGNFSRKVIHLLMVLAVSFGYFGTINATKGGLYILDGIRDLSNQVVETFSNVTFNVATGEKLKVDNQFSDDYVEKTSYQAYLFVNTGRIDGKFYNKQTEKLEKFSNDKVLGKSDDSGNFKEASSKDRAERLDWLGNGANDGNERDRWVSAVLDYLFLKVVYVVGSIIKAIALPIPYLVIHILRIALEILVLLLILFFPVAIVLSFIPVFQDLFFGMFKLILSSSVLPSFGTIMILACSIVDSMFSNGIVKLFTKEDTGSTNLMLSNLISGLLSLIVYLMFWKYKGFIFNILAGEFGSRVDETVDKPVNFVGSGVKNTVDFLTFQRNKSKYLPSPEDYGSGTQPKQTSVDYHTPETEESRFSLWKKKEETTQQPEQVDIPTEQEDKQTGDRNEPVQTTVKTDDDKDFQAPETEQTPDGSNVTIEDNRNYQGTVSSDSTFSPDMNQPEVELRSPEESYIQSLHDERGKSVVENRKYGVYQEEVEMPRTDELIIEEIEPRKDTSIDEMA